MTRFEGEILIRWTRTDPAGLVFYPHYFEMVNQVVEDWFAGSLPKELRAHVAEFEPRLAG